MWQSMGIKVYDKININRVMLTNLYRLCPVRICCLSCFRSRTWSHYHRASRLLPSSDTSVYNRKRCSRFRSYSTRDHWPTLSTVERFLTEEISSFLFFFVFALLCFVFVLNKNYALLDHLFIRREYFPEI